MTKLEQELALADNDTGLLCIDTKSDAADSSQVSPYFPSTPSNPLVSQHKKTYRSHREVPVTTRIPAYSLDISDRDVFFIDTTKIPAKEPDLPQLSQRPSAQAPVLVQQLVQSPLYVNLAAGNIKHVRGTQQPVIQFSGSQINQQANLQSQNPQVLIQNNPKTVAPLILKGSDANFSPVIFQSNLIHPEQTYVYTSGPVQGKLFFCLRNACN